MLTRENLRLCTCHQLAGFIEQNWEEMDEPVLLALKLLHKIDEPEGLLITNGVVSCLKDVQSHTSCWNTPEANLIKRELVTRIKEYENYLERRTAQGPDSCFKNCDIKLPAELA